MKKTSFLFFISLMCVFCVEYNAQCIDNISYAPDLIVSETDHEVKLCTDMACFAVDNSNEIAALSGNVENDGYPYVLNIYNLYTGYIRGFKVKFSNAHINRGLECIYYTDDGKLNFYVDEYKVIYTISTLDGTVINKSKENIDQVWEKYEICSEHNTNIKPSSNVLSLEYGNGILTAKLRNLDTRIVYNYEDAYEQHTGRIIKIYGKTSVPGVLMLAVSTIIFIYVITFKVMKSKGNKL